MWSKIVTFFRIVALVIGDVEKMDRRGQYERLKS